MAKPSPLDYALLTGIGLSWGSQFILNQLAIASIPPLMVSTGRVLIGCAVLTSLIWAFPQFGRFQANETVKQPWGKFALIGITEAIVPYFLVPWGQQHVSASAAAILLATIPIFTLLLAPIFIKNESYNVVTTVGVMLGFAGVVILVAPHQQAFLLSELSGELAILGGALSFSISLILIKRLPSIPPLLVIRNIFLMASLPLVVATLIWHPPWTLSISTKSSLALIALGIICGAMAYAMYISLLNRMGATFTSLSSYLVTLFGVLIGVGLLGNRLHSNDLLAMLFIMAALGVHQFRHR